MSTPSLICPRDTGSESVDISFEDASAVDRLAVHTANRTLEDSNGVYAVHCILALILALGGLPLRQ
jgi:hypothetical protein